MSILKATKTWSAPVTLTEAELWQCREGTAQITTETIVDDDQGYQLAALDSLRIGAGRTVRYRAAVGRAIINREAVE